MSNGSSGNRLVILKSWGRVVDPGWIFRATGLYFFLATAYAPEGPASESSYAVSTENLVVRT